MHQFTNTYTVHIDLLIIHIPKVRMGMQLPAGLPFLFSRETEASYRFMYVASLLGSYVQLHEYS